MKIYLDDDFREELADAFLFDVTSEVLVAESQLELESLGDVRDARVWPLFGVQFAAEDAVGLDADDHVRWAAVDGHVVAGRQFVGGRTRDLQVRLLHGQTQRMNAAQDVTFDFVTVLFTS